MKQGKLHQTRLIIRLSEDNWSKDTLGRIWSWFTIGSLFQTHRLSSKRDEFHPKKKWNAFTMLGKTGCVLPWLPLSKCCIDLSTCCFPKHWHVSNRIRGQIDWRDTERGDQTPKTQTLGCHCSGSPQDGFEGHKLLHKVTGFGGVRHLCVSSIFICRPSNNTAASPKDQGRCLLHFSFLKGACGLSSFQGSFELKLCIKELTVLPGERSFKKSLLKQQEVGAARQISFVNSAQ